MKLTYKNIKKVSSNINFHITFAMFIFAYNNLDNLDFIKKFFFSTLFFILFKI